MAVPAMVREGAVGPASARRGSWLRRLGLAVVGGLGLSHWSYALPVTLLGLPLYAPGVVLVPLLLWMLRRSEAGRVARSAVLAGGIVVWTGLFLISLAYGVEPYAAVRGGRPFFYLLCGVGVGLLVRREFLVDTLFWLSVGAVFGDALFGVLNVLTVTKSGINLVAIAVVAAASFRRRSAAGMLFAILIGGVAGVVSGYRAVIATTVAGAGSGYLFGVLERGRRPTTAVVDGVKVLGILVFVAGVGIFAAGQLDLGGRLNFYHHHIVDRTRMVLSGETQMSGDAERFRRIGRGLDVAEKNAGPAGFVGQTSGRWGLYFDAPVHFFTDTFGAPVGWTVWAGMLFAIPLLVVGRIVLFGPVRREVAFLAAVLCTLAVVGVVNGRYVTIEYDAAMAGLLLGLGARAALEPALGARSDGDGAGSSPDGAAESD